MLRITSLFIAIVLLGCTSVTEYNIIENPALGDAKYPRIYSDNTGRVFMSWYETHGDSVLLKYSEYHEDGFWNEPSLVKKSVGWFINWADFQSMITIDGKPMAAHWLRDIPDNPNSYIVQIKSFQTSGVDTITPHDDATITEHGFVSLYPTSDSTFYTIWLDGRNTKSHSHSEVKYGDLSTAMTLRGAEFDLNLNKLNESLIDDATCDCCNTALTITSNGLLVAYRNRTDEEIRDIYISRMIDGVWTKGEAIAHDNWKIAACPVNGPALDSYGTSTAITWFTSTEESPTVKLSFSTDGGTSFDSPIELNNTTTLGRLDIQFVDEQSVWVSWLNKKDDSGEIVLQKISTDGTISKEITIPGVYHHRSTGFPQISLINDDTILVAWTHKYNGVSEIKTALIH